MNERANEDGVEDTRPSDRVSSIISRTYEYRSLSAIAERALVSGELARMHLDRLVEDGFVEVDDGGEPRYRRAPDSIVRERVNQSLETVDVETLEDRVEELREAVYEYRHRDDLADEEITEWQTALRNLYIAETALEFVEGGGDE